MEKLEPSKVQVRCPRHRPVVCTSGNKASQTRRAAWKLGVNSKNEGPRVFAQFSPISPKSLVIDGGCRQKRESRREQSLRVFWRKTRTYPDKLSAGRVNSNRGIFELNSKLRDRGSQGQLSEKHLLTGNSTKARKRVKRSDPKSAGSYREQLGAMGGSEKERLGASAGSEKER
jgi:hypothetical protein